MKHCILIENVALSTNCNQFSLATGTHFSQSFPCPPWVGEVWMAACVALSSSLHVSDCICNSTDSFTPEKSPDLQSTEK